MVHSWFYPDWFFALENGVRLLFVTSEPFIQFKLQASNTWRLNCYSSLKWVDQGVHAFDTSYWSSVTQNLRNYTIWKYSIMKKDTSEHCVIMAVINCTKIELPVKCDIKLYRNTFQTLFEHWFILIKRNERNTYMVYVHDDVIKWKHIPRYWPFVRGIHRSPVNSPHKGQWRGALIFTLICARINGWVNNREAGDLRRYRAHYDVIVM